VLQRADDRPVCPGVDRVLWLRVTVRNGQPCEGVVHGIRHRHPVDVAVSPDVVRRLLAAGAPAVTTGDGG
jgi:hypothetical protein